MKMYNSLEKSVGKLLVFLMTLTKPYKTEINAVGEKVKNYSIHTDDEDYIYYSISEEQSKERTHIFISFNASVFHSIIFSPLNFNYSITTIYNYTNKCTFEIISYYKYIGKKSIHNVGNLNDFSRYADNLINYINDIIKETK